MIIGWILIALVGFLVSVLILILVVPFTYMAKAENANEWRLYCRVGWFFHGIVIDWEKKQSQQAHIEVRLFGYSFTPSISSKGDKQKEKLKKEKEKHKKKKKKKKTSFFRNLDRAFLHRTVRFAKELFVALQPDDLHIDARIVFDDPCDTAWMVAALSFLPMVGNRWKVEVVPVFDEQVLNGYAKITGRIVLVRYVALIIAYALSKPARKMFFNRKEGTL